MNMDVSEWLASWQRKVDQSRRLSALARRESERAYWAATAADYVFHADRANDFDAAAWIVLMR